MKIPPLQKRRKYEVNKVGRVKKGKEEEKRCRENGG
jgi:hypothetical protein